MGNGWAGGGLKMGCGYAWMGLVGSRLGLGMCWAGGEQRLGLVKVGARRGRRRGRGLPKAWAARVLSVKCAF